MDFFEMFVCPAWFGRVLSSDSTPKSREYGGESTSVKTDGVRPPYCVKPGTAPVKPEPPECVVIRG